MQKSYAPKHLRCSMDQEISATPKEWLLYLHQRLVLFKFHFIQTIKLLQALGLEGIIR